MNRRLKRPTQLGGEKGNIPQWQDVRANIWDAVLAVGLPVVNGVIVWLGPEVLLSLLPEIKSDYTLGLILASGARNDNSLIKPQVLLSGFDKADCSVLLRL